MSLIETYFPEIDPALAERFLQMEELYRDWNSRINVISRKDMEMMGVHHILHSLAIARITRFRPGTSIMDAGTGGGFPGIPLAMMFPEARFTLVDSIGKKIKVVESVAASLGLKNVTVVNARFESVRQKFDFVTGRAVSNLPLFASMVRPCLKMQGTNELPNGILYLTGGEIETDLSQIRADSSVYRLADYFSEPYFDTKKLVHLYNFS